MVANGVQVKELCILSARNTLWMNRVLSTLWSSLVYFAGALTFDCDQVEGTYQRLHWYTRVVVWHEQLMLSLSQNTMLTP